MGGRGGNARASYGLSQGGEIRFSIGASAFSPYMRARIFHGILGRFFHFAQAPQMGAGWLFAGPVVIRDILGGAADSVTYERSGREMPARPL